MRTRISGLLLILCTFATEVAGAADPYAPFVGKWMGSVESNTETLSAGLDIRRLDDGTVTVFITLPIINRFEVGGVGTATVDGDRLIHEPLGLDLTHTGDTLSGEVPRLGRIELRRVESLPVDEPPGAFPDIEVLWHARTSGRIYASPVVADASVYVGTTGGVFLAVDADTGREQWRTAVGYPIRGAATVHGDAVYLVSDGGFLHKLSRPDGAEIWRYRLGEPGPRVMPHVSLPDWDWHSPKPIIADGRVFVGGADGTAHAVDIEHGEVVWTADAGSRIRAGAAVAGDRVVFGTDAGHLRAFARADGAPAWAFETGAMIDTTPVVADGRVFVGNRGFGLFAVDLPTGSEIWRSAFWGSWVEATPVVHDGTLYIGSSDLRRVSAIDAATGRIEWRSDVFGWAWGTPLVIDDRLYIGTAGGEPYPVRHLAAMTELDRKDGRILRRSPLDASSGWMWGIAGSPARAGDRIIVATIEGGILAFVP